MKKYSKKITGWVAGLMILAAAGGLVFPAYAAGEQKEPGVEFAWGVKIPMRDGIKLNANVYLPKERSGPLPVIFALTPYTADYFQARAMYFVKHEYVFVVVDCRGRGNSEGAFDPFVHDSLDGYDIVEWLAVQPWSNGKVAMWGGSYGGFVQWATAKAFPPHLATIIPAASVHPGIDFPNGNNIFSTYFLRWLTFVSGATLNTNLFGDEEFWREKNEELFLKHLPFKSFDSLVGNKSTAFQKILEHPAYDETWKSIGLTPEQYAGIGIPILTITGYFDGDQPGALYFYRSHMKSGSPEAKAAHHLIIGPWDHAGTRTARSEVGGMTFGPASVLDLNEMNRAWYDWILKGKEKPAFLKDRVAYYLPGAEEWKYAASLEDISRENTILFLSADTETTDVFHSGRLMDSAAKSSASVRFSYDPLDTTPLMLEREASPDYLTEQMTAFNLDGKGAIYHSLPFEKETEITGNVKFTVWMSLNVPDTDFRVSLCEILKDGSSVYLCEDMMRARYRDSISKETLVKPGEINRYVFDTFTYFSRRIAKGSRLRLILTCPNSPRLEKNYNTGGVVAEESGKDARTAVVRVYHDAKHPSSLELPVVSDASGSGKEKGN